MCRVYRLRNGLVVAQVALAFVLVSGAGLLIRSFARLTSVDAGFDATNVNARPAYWDSVDSRLDAAGVSAAQVQVVWLKEAIAGEHRRFPKDAKALQASLRKIITTMRFRYPKLRLVYLSSRTYGGYAITGWNPEPAAYAKQFTGKYAHRLIAGVVGHNLPQEAWQAFAQAVVDVAQL